MKSCDGVELQHLGLFGGRRFRVLGSALHAACFVGLKVTIQATSRKSGVFQSSHSTAECAQAHISAQEAHIAFAKFGNSGFIMPVSPTRVGL